MINSCNHILQNIEFLLLTDYTLVLYYLKQYLLISDKGLCADIVYFVMATGFSIFLTSNIKTNIENKLFIYRISNQIYIHYVLSLIYRFIDISYNNIISVIQYTSFDESFLINSYAFNRISTRILSVSSFLLTKPMKL
jgi:hypothetical protein